MNDDSSTPRCVAVLADLRSLRDRVTRAEFVELSREREGRRDSELADTSVELPRACQSPPAVSWDRDQYADSCFLNSDGLSLPLPSTPARTPFIDGTPSSFTLQQPRDDSASCASGSGLGLGSTTSSGLEDSDTLTIKTMKDVEQVLDKQLGTVIEVCKRRFPILLGCQKRNKVSHADESTPTAKLIETIATWSTIRTNYVSTDDTADFIIKTIQTILQLLMKLRQIAKDADNCTKSFLSNTITEHRNALSTYRELRSSRSRNGKPPGPHVPQRDKSYKPSRSAFPSDQKKKGSRACDDSEPKGSKRSRRK